MKESEFRRALKDEFGEAYSRVLVRDHWVRSLGGTAEELIEKGASPRSVWQALCADFDVPPDRWHGRGMLEPKE